MIDLDQAAEHLNAKPVTEPSPVEAIYRRARAIRRRLLIERAASGTVLVLLAVAVGVGITRSSDTSIHVATGPGPRPPSAVAPGPAPSVTPPAELVAHFPTGTGQPGNIAVIDTATGAVTKVLGADYDPYVGDGFHIAAGGRSVFWTHLNEPAQQFPITEAPLDGGPQRTVVTDGTDDLPSPDGRYLLVHVPTDQGGLEVVDLASGATRLLPAPAPVDGQVLATPSWLPDGHTVIAVAVTPGSACSTPAGGTCPATTTTPAQMLSHLWSIDAASPTAAWTPMGADGGAWNGVQLLGPGRLPDTVAAFNTDSTGRTTELLTLRTDGSILDRLVLAGVQVFGVDHSGTNFLVGDSSGLARVSFADPTPVHIGPTVAEAVWW